MRPRLLAVECLLLFGLVPLGLLWLQLQGRLIFFPILIGLFLIALVLGLRDPEVRHRFPPPAEGYPRALAGILLRATAAALALTALTLAFTPHLFLRFPRENLPLWALVMLLYPLLSVAPQAYLFRVFFLQRYPRLFGQGWPLLLANAFLFGWAHIFMLNATAPLLSLVAGLLLARAWQRHPHFWLSWLEHALYGQIVFTVGLGWYFYNGSAQALRVIAEP